jgi:hypothetical protein
MNALGGEDLAAGLEVELDPASVEEYRAHLLQARRQRVKKVSEPRRCPLSACAKQQKGCAIRTERIEFVATRVDFISPS